MIDDRLEGVISAAQLGQEWAWSRLYEHLAPSLMGYFRIRGSPDAEDLVGETFLQLARNLPSFDGEPSSFRSWVFMIAHNRLSNTRRRYARKPELLVESVEEGLDAAPSAETLALTHVAGGEAVGLMACLPEAQRDVVALRFIADLSVSETAAALGVSEGSVKQTTRRALKRLRREISREAVTR